ncbi:MAG TPA: GNAT family N-acetyltransferase [Stellaceae bacterium]|nr:GNAT family N-acetyltransferase [Stellaceae bacterium]
MTATSTNIVVASVAAPTPEAVAMLTELDAVLGAEYEPHQRHALSLDQLFQPGVRFFIASIDEAPVGCGGVALFADFAEVKRMYARPTVRGRGIGKALLARIEAEARAAGKPVLRLETGIHQKAAIGLYRRCGFRECGVFGQYAALAPAQIATSVFFEKPL